eukprot:7513621-Pyramimonas_sp.AAC.1
MGTCLPLRAFSAVLWEHSGRLGGPVGRLEVILGRRGATLGRLGALFDCLGALLSGPSWSFLEAPE